MEATRVEGSRLVTALDAALSAKEKLQAAATAQVAEAEEITQ
jgi:hypothetical protein